MQYVNEKTTDYLFRLRNAQKINEACNGSIITRAVPEHRMKILFPLHTTRFDSLQENEKKEAEITREEILYATLS